VAAGLPETTLLVVGAHLRRQPLEHQLSSRGARWLGAARTAAAYELKALATTPPKPGLVRVGHGGAAIAGELWQLSLGALGDFLADLPAPMMLGSVELDDGRWVVGFGCAADAATEAVDITAHGGWLSWLAR